MKTLRVLITLLVIACGLVFSGCERDTTPPQLQRTVLSETPVCTIESKVIGTPVIYSPDGRHVAFITDRDGKRSVVVDGVIGKSYDVVTISFASFSPDGTRFACQARIFDEMTREYRDLVVIDGEEGDSYQSVDQFVFSADSRHVAYIADGGVFIDRMKVDIPGTVLERKSLIIGPTGNKVACVIDLDGKQAVAEGKTVEPAYDEIGTVMMSSDGNHLAYQARSGESWCIVKDGIPGKSYDSVSEPVFSPDSRHFAYFGIDRSEFGRKATIVVRDGIEGEPHRTGQVTISNLFFSDDSEHLYYVYKDILDRTDLSVLYRDGEGTTVLEGEVHEIAFSPNGESMACIVHSHKFGFRLFVDGIEKWRGDSISDICFSPDGSRILYITGRGSTMIVNIDKTPGNEYEFPGVTMATPSARDMGIDVITFDTPDIFRYLARKGVVVYLVREQLP